jgi:signal transduction histidine kinase
LFSLLENLLEWARIQRGHISFNPAVHKVRELTEECISVLGAQADLKAINISLQISDGLTFFADKNMMQVVIRNLISNAIKFTPHKGEIVIAARFSESKRVEFSVRDNGIGMDATLVKNLFNMDTANKRKGTDGEISTGLGLVLCKEIIEKHNGKIWAESQENKGSVFYFFV